MYCNKKSYLTRKRALKFKKRLEHKEFFRKELEKLNKLFNEKDLLLIKINKGIIQNFKDIDFINNKISKIEKRLKLNN